MQKDDRFPEIEGLRAWLAWTVVLFHIAATSDLYRSGIGLRLAQAGYDAVLIFIIISGFVIAHMSIERNERYGPYITRRFFRLYPLFVVTCTAGAFAMPLHHFVLMHVAWVNDPAYVLDKEVGEVVASQSLYLWQHILAHTLMVHGAISNGILPFSQYAFLIPAWSISLEWQFYLVAPLIMFLTKTARGRLIALAFVFLGGSLATTQLLGSFRNPSFLPAAAGFFAIGIACRLSLNFMRDEIKPSCWASLIFLAISPFGGPQFFAVMLWLAFYCAMISQQRHRLFDLAFKSRVSQYLGARSYSTYLCHAIVISMTHYAIIRFAPSLGRGATFLCLIAIVPISTLLVSAFLYRAVELPGIAIGSRLARSLSERA